MAKMLERGWWMDATTVRPSRARSRSVAMTWRTDRDRELVDSAAPSLSGTGSSNMAKMLERGWWMDATTVRPSRARSRSVAIAWACAR